MEVSGSRQIKIFARKLGNSWESASFLRHPCGATLPGNEECKDVAANGRSQASDSLQYTADLKTLKRIDMLTPHPIKTFPFVIHCLRALAIALSIIVLADINLADEANAASAANSTAPFAAAVVEKAEGILQEAGLRRSGKAIQSTEAAELSRLLSGINRERRELRLQQKAFAEYQSRLAAFETEIDKLNAQDGELNLQLARVAGLDVAGNNRIVAMINATRTQISQLRKQRSEHTKKTQEARATLNTAEQKYAESVFQARKRLDELSTDVTTKLQDRQVQIALDVMHANFEVPKEIEADQIMRAFEYRLRDFEKEVFQETIPLEVATNGALHTTVSINQQSIRMVIDSGATLITLPADAAAKLQIVIPPDAVLVNLVLANGQKIGGRRVTLGSVRVGQFEAKDVEAVVLEPMGVTAEPLLGLSYLDRYKFELDPAAKTLGLLRVDDSENDGDTAKP
jgi:aspartyl protease family protein